MSSLPQFWLSGTSGLAFNKKITRHAKGQE